VNVVRYPEAGGLDVKEADQPPGSGETVNLSAVVDFISDLAGSRLGALGGLIDAVAAALDGGPPVVLAAPNADQGALWIGAVSFFTPPAVSLRLSFSTHERWDDVIAQRLRDGSADLDAEGEGWHTPVLSVVPQADVDRLTRREDPPVVVIDPRVETVFTVVDGVAYRQTHLGQRIRVTEWSGRALAACCADYAVLERRVRDFHSAGPDAPSDESRTDTELAWERLQTGEPAGSGESSVFEHYLRLALDDDSWLLRRAPPLPIAPRRPAGRSWAAWSGTCGGCAGRIAGTSWPWPRGSCARCSSTTPAPARLPSAAAPVRASSSPKRPE
jgi:hypothetical protein